MIEADPAKWPVPHKYQKAFADVIQDHDLRLLQVFDMNDELVDPTKIQQTLPGSLVQVTFRMFFYPIKDRDTNTIKNSLTGKLLHTLSVMIL